MDGIDGFWYDGVKWNCKEGSVLGMMKNGPIDCKRPKDELLILWSLEMIKTALNNAYAKNT
jgi:hypothetical protein